MSGNRRPYVIVVKGVIPKGVNLNGKARRFLKGKGLLMEDAMDLYVERELKTHGVEFSRLPLEGERLEAYNTVLGLTKEIAALEKQKREAIKLVDW